MCVCVGSFFVSMCPQLVPSRPFFIVWGLGDGFVNDTAGKAISAEGAITFLSAVACGRSTLFGLMTLLLCFLMIWAIFSVQL